jgi:hypothetical protein
MDARGTRGEGPRLVARAWLDPEFKARLLQVRFGCSFMYFKSVCCLLTVFCVVVFIQLRRAGASVRADACSKRQGAWRAA